MSTTTLTPPALPERPQWADRMTWLEEPGMDAAWPFEYSAYIGRLHFDLSESYTLTASNEWSVSTALAVLPPRIEDWMTASDLRSYAADAMHAAAVVEKYSRPVGTVVR